MRASRTARREPASETSAALQPLDIAVLCRRDCALLWLRWLALNTSKSLCRGTRSVYRIGRATAQVGRAVHISGDFQSHSSAMFPPVPENLHSLPHSLATPANAVHTPSPDISPIRKMRTQHIGFAADFRLAGNTCCISKRGKFVVDSRGKSSLVTSVRYPG